MKIYDAIIIGSGQGGTPLAKKLAKAGWKTALIEKAYAGGTCVNVGCTPTKTMIASAKAIHTIKRAEEWGLKPLPAPFMFMLSDSLFSLTQKAPQSYMTAKAQHLIP